MTLQRRKLAIGLVFAMSLGRGGGIAPAYAHASGSDATYKLDGSVMWLTPIAAAPTRLVETGFASVYGDRLQGRPTSSGEPYDRAAPTAAHRTLPFGTQVRITSLETRKSVVVRINDRGPHVAGRIIDLSASAAKRLGMGPRGVAKVRLEVLALRSN